MNPVRPQNTPESPTLLNDLKAEVSAESAPLLQFIVRNSGLIVGVVVVLLVALVGTAVWRWHQGGLQAEAQTELARIGITMKGGDRLKALDDLAAKAPENMRYSIYLMQAEFAMQDQDYSRAEKAYATAAKLDADGAMGLMAALGQAGALIKLDRPADAVTLLQGLESRATEDGRACACCWAKPPKRRARPMWPLPPMKPWPPRSLVWTVSFTARARKRWAVARPRP